MVPTPPFYLYVALASAPMFVNAFVTDLVSGSATDLVHAT